MKSGAFIMMDALGFKDIWRAPEFDGHPERMLSQMKALQAAAQHDFEERVTHPPYADPRPVNSNSLYEGLTILFLSDTVIIALEADPNWPVTDTRRAPFSLMLASAFASSLMAKASRLSPIALAYRGCVSYGSFAIEDNFIIGPAVDEASRMMNAAQGAFVWLTPSASEKWNSVSMVGLAPAVRYDVPMKDGSRLSTETVIPFDVMHPLGERTGTRDRILKTFDRSDALEVKVKKQETALFLESALRYRADHDRAFYADVDD